MKRSSLAAVLAAAVFVTSVAFAADKEVTLVGAGQCAKCSLGLTKSCQNALVVKKEGKEETYLLAANDVSEKFHDNICSDIKEIKVTGVVAEVAGKKVITPSRIELVKG
jgi:hypothetical protein